MEAAGTTGKLISSNQSTQRHVTEEMVFAVVYIECSLCRLLRLLSTWCRAAAFFSASGVALSQEIPAVK
jgi:hypothetical protein